MLVTRRYLFKLGSRISCYHWCIKMIELCRCHPIPLIILPPVSKCLTLGRGPGTLFSNFINVDATVIFRTLDIILGFGFIQISSNHPISWHHLDCSWSLEQTERWRRVIVGWHCMTAMPSYIHPVYPSIHRSLPPSPYKSFSPSPQVT